MAAAYLGGLWTMMQGNSERMPEELHHDDDGVDAGGMTATYLDGLGTMRGALPAAWQPPT